MPKLLHTLALAAALTSTALAADAYKWSVQYLIDNSQPIEGRSQKKYPRGTRCLALSPDGRYLYAGYLHSWEGRGELRKIAVDQEDFENATESVLSGPTCKAVATDDRGHVYVTDKRGIAIYDASLEEEIHHIIAPNTEGIALVREGSKLLMFTSDRSRGNITRWVLTEDGDRVVGAEPTGFDGTGMFHVPHSMSLRGVKVDPTGNIWVCDYEAGKVFRVRKDGKDVKDVEIRTPMDLAFDGNRVFVTRGPERAITVLDHEMTVVGSLNVPWQELEISMWGNNRGGALSGIVTVPGKGFYVANEGGQTSDQQSIYGRADDKAELIEGKVIRDTKDDDNEPILKATAVVTTAGR